MRSILLFFNILITFCVISNSFVNPYLQFDSFSSQTTNDGKDPGDALFLTKYIESGDIETARSLALVNHPDMQIPSYAGYFTVDKKYDSNMFFWFFPAKENPDDAPVVLWLTGGPGAATSVEIFLENGPFIVGPDQRLIPRKYSWHIQHNLIYIDNPVGAGFSFTNSEDGYAKNEVDVGDNLLCAMQQFFLLFPNLQKNEFFATGFSYAGKYVPALGYAIFKDSKRVENYPQKPKINLKGIAIGNGFTDPIHQLNHGEYLYQLGLIDSNGLKSFVRYQKQEIGCIKRRDFECAFEVFDKLILGVQYPYGTLFKNLTGLSTNDNYIESSTYISITHLSDFLSKSEIRRAIHVGNSTFHDPSIVFEHLKLDIMDSVADWVAELLSHYSILVYSGQLDIIAAYPLTENYLKHLNFNGADDYKTAKRHIWRADNDIAGYVKQAGNLTEVLIRKAGHFASVDQPKWVLDMLLSFTHHKSFY